MMSCHLPKLAALSLIGICVALGPSVAGSKKSAPETPATSIHGAPGNTPGFGGNSANPNGNGVNGGDGIHDIGGGAPGQAGYNPAKDGRDPANSMHGGLNDTTGRDSPLD